MTAPSPSVRRSLARLAVVPSRVSVGAVAVVAAAATLGSFPPVPPWLAYLPFGLSVVFLGLPHGAVDHLVPGRLGSGVTAASMTRVGVLYAVLMAAYAVVWFLAPLPAFVGFVALTWFHWGQGDLYTVQTVLGADHLPTTAERLLALVVRGGLPMLVPLLAFPDRYLAVMRAVVGLFSAPPAIDAVDSVRVVAGAGLAGATLASVGLGAIRVRRGARRGPWAADAGEVALLWAYFALVPPVVAVGVYFSVWHALRHVARLAAADDRARAALAAGDLRTVARRFARDAAPLTAAALAVFLLLALVVPNPPAGLDRRGLLGLYLVGIAVLTLPHVVVVTWMDLTEGVWPP